MTLEATLTEALGAGEGEASSAPDVAGEASAAVAVVGKPKETMGASSSLLKVRMAPLSLSPARACRTSGMECPVLKARPSTAAAWRDTSSLFLSQTQATYQLDPLVVMPP